MSDNKSGADRGFKIRMGVLLTILVVLGCALVLDKFVLFPRNEKAIAQAFEFFEKNFDGLTRQKFQEHIGFAPAETLDRGRYKVDVFSYGTIPLKAPVNVYAVYEDDICLHLTQKGEDVVSEEELLRQLKPAARKVQYTGPQIVDPDAPVATASSAASTTTPMSGGATSTDNDDAKKDDEKSDEKSEEKSGDGDGEEKDDSTGS